MRTEVCCAWCVQWTPRGRFCRECGSELIDAERYAAARMLKRAGVDQFTLATRVRELDPEQAEHFKRIYDTHYALVLRAVDEVHACEAFLVQKHHGRELQDRLIAELPFTEERLKTLKNAFPNPMSPDGADLVAMAKHSIHDSTANLAAMALIRGGQWLDLDHSLQAELSEQVQSCLHHENESLALEAGFIFAHWYFREPFGLDVFFQQPLDLKRVAMLAQSGPAVSRLAGWRALLACLADPGQFESRRYLLEKGVDDNDRDLALACALRLNRVESLQARLLNPQSDEALVAAVQLAQSAPETLADFFRRAPHDRIAAVLPYLPSPPPVGISRTLLALLIEAENVCDPAMVDQCLAVIESALASNDVRSLADNARRNDDIAWLQRLLQSAIEDKAPLVQAAMDMNRLDSLESELNACHGGLLQNHEHVWIALFQRASRSLAGSMLIKLDQWGQALSPAMLDCLRQYIFTPDGEPKNKAVSIYIKHAGEPEVRALIDYARLNQDTALLQILLEQSLPDIAYAVDAALDLGMLDALAGLSVVGRADFVGQYPALTARLLNQAHGDLASPLVYAVHKSLDQCRQPLSDDIVAGLVSLLIRDVSGPRFRTSDQHRVWDIVLANSNIGELDRVVTWALDTDNKRAIETVLTYDPDNSCLGGDFPFRSLDKSAALYAAIRLGMCSWTTMWRDWAKSSVLEPEQVLQLIDLDDYDNTAWLLFVAQLQHEQQQGLPQPLATVLVTFACQVRAYFQDYQLQKDSASFLAHYPRLAAETIVPKRWQQQPTIADPLLELCTAYVEKLQDSYTALDAIIAATLFRDLQRFEQPLNGDNPAAAEFMEHAWQLLQQCGSQQDCTFFESLLGLLCQHAQAFSDPERVLSELDEHEDNRTAALVDALRLTIP